MPRRLLLIVNPKSGREMVKPQLLGILDTFSKAGYTTTVYVTQAAGEGRTVAAAAQGYDMIACCGGDGTLDEVVSGLIDGGRRIPVGYIPAGSTNDYAGTLGLSHNMQQAARDVVNGTPFDCDVGRFGDDTFVYVAAFGAFTEVSYDTSQDLKNVFGRAAYLLEGVKRIKDIRSYSVHAVSAAGCIEGEFLYGMITNSKSVGGFKGITGADVELDDGQLEVLLIRCPETLTELNSLIPALMQRAAGVGTAIVDRNDCFISFKTSEIRFTFDEPIPWTLDGEFGGTCESVTVAARPRAMTIMVPDIDRVTINPAVLGGNSMLVPATEMLQKARDGHYAVGQFNINNLEWTKAILQTAEEQHSPVILGVSEGAGKYMGGYDVVMGMVNGMIKDMGITVPVAVHLDHGTFEGCYKCIEAGFSSIMFDGSHYPIAENIEKTKQLVHDAHEKGISIEAEVGAIGGEEDGVIAMGECADPNECKQIADLGVDFLAAGIGNIHGKYPANWPGLSFETLEAVKAKTGDMPLVLHGGTGIPDDQVTRAIKNGVAKINVNTECQLVFAEATRKYVEAGKDLEGKGFDPRKLLAPGTAAIKDKVAEKMKLFGSVGKA